MAPPAPPEPAEARRAARRLGEASASRRMAALARYVDLLEPPRRPDIVPRPEAVETLADPVGRLGRFRHGGDHVHASLRLPLGLVAADPRLPGLDLAALAGLAIGSGNALWLVGPLEGGDEPVVSAARQALAEAGLPEAAITHADEPEAELPTAVDAVLGPDLAPTEDASPELPVVHTYVDGAADVDQALQASLEAARREGPLATETILVHEALAVALLEDLVAALQDEGLAVEAGEAARRRAPRAQAAAAATWQGRAGVCGVRVVGSLAEALEHIREYGGHVEAIHTREADAAERFARGTQAEAIALQTPTTAAERLDLADPHPRRLAKPPSRLSDLTREASILAPARRDWEDEAPGTLGELVARLFR